MDIGEPSGRELVFVEEVEKTLLEEEVEGTKFDEFGMSKGCDIWKEKRRGKGGSKGLKVELDLIACCWRMEKVK